jgi:hypothetical protein
MKMSQMTDRALEIMGMSEGRSRTRAINAFHRDAMPNYRAIAGTFLYRGIQENRDIDDYVQIVAMQADTILNRPNLAGYDFLQILRRESVAPMRDFSQSVSSTGVSGSRGQVDRWRITLKAEEALTAMNGTLPTTEEVIEAAQNDINARFGNPTKVGRVTESDRIQIRPILVGEHNDFDVMRQNHDIEELTLPGQGSLAASEVAGFARTLIDYAYSISDDHGRVAEMYLHPCMDPNAPAVFNVTTIARGSGISVSRCRTIIRILKAHAIEVIQDHLDIDVA